MNDPEMSLIDQQHRELVDMFNKLNKAVQERNDREEIFRIIDDVVAITRLHFETEEQLMERSGYADIDWHKNKHQELINDALHLKEKLTYIGEEMFTDWLTHWPFGRVLAHIQYTDNQFKDYLLHDNK